MSTLAESPQIGSQRHSGSFQGVRVDSPNLGQCDQAVLMGYLDHFMGDCYTLFLWKSTVRPKRQGIGGDPNADPEDSMFQAER
jgi:hypothetical protein